MIMDWLLIVISLPIAMLMTPQSVKNEVAINYSQFAMNVNQIYNDMQQMDMPNDCAGDVAGNEIVITHAAQEVRNRKKLGRLLTLQDIVFHQNIGPIIAQYFGGGCYQGTNVVPHGIVLMYMMKQLNQDYRLGVDRLADARPKNSYLIIKLPITLKPIQGDDWTACEHADDVIAAMRLRCYSNVLLHPIAPWYNYLLWGIVLLKKSMQKPSETIAQFSTQGSHLKHLMITIVPIDVESYCVHNGVCAENQNQIDVDNIIPNRVQSHDVNAIYLIAKGEIIRFLETSVGTVSKMGDNKDFLAELLINNILTRMLSLAVNDSYVVDGEAHVLLVSLGSESYMEDLLFVMLHRDPERYFSYFTISNIPACPDFNGRGSEFNQFKAMFPQFYTQPA